MNFLLILNRGWKRLWIFGIDSVFIYYVHLLIFLDLIFIYENYKHFDRAKQVLGYSDSELADKGCYDLVHYDDLAYVASAHQERKY